jgi:hypothetical protein
MLHPVPVIFFHPMFMPVQAPYFVPNPIPHIGGKNKEKPISSLPGTLSDTLRRALHHLQIVILLYVQVCRAESPSSRFQLGSTRNQNNLTSQLEFIKSLLKHMLI